MTPVVVVYLFTYKDISIPFVLCVNTIKIDMDDIYKKTGIRCLMDPADATTYIERPLRIMVDKVE